MRALSALSFSALLLAASPLAAATKNRAPVMNTPAEIPVEIGQDLSLDVSAFDPDGDLIALRAENLPGDASFSDFGDGSGLIQFIPRAQDVGRNEITIFANDGQGGESFAVVVIEVLAPPPPDVVEVEEGCAVAPASSLPATPGAALFFALALAFLRRRAPR